MGRLSPVPFHCKSTIIPLLISPLRELLELPPDANLLSYKILNQRNRMGVCASWIRRLIDRDSSHARLNSLQQRELRKIV